MKQKIQRNYELSNQTLFKFELLLKNLSPLVKRIVVIDKERLLFNAYTKQNQLEELNGAKWVTNNIYDYLIDNHKAIKDTLLIVNNTSKIKDEIFVQHNVPLKNAFHNIETHLKTNNNFIIKL